MKKILALLLTLVLALGISLSVSAEVGGFVSSPSTNRAPDVIDVEKPEDKDCVADVVVTPFGDRSDLPENLRQQMEEAYTIIASTKDISDLTNVVKKLAESQGIDVKNLAISDLFSVCTNGCTDHADHGNFKLTLNPDAVKNFVCLLYYFDGQWRIVEDAKITSDGYLQFTEMGDAPYAVVVNTGEAVVKPDVESEEDADAEDKEDVNSEEDTSSKDDIKDEEDTSSKEDGKGEDTDTPQTGDNSNIILYLVIMVVSAVALFFVWKKSKKKDM